MPKAPLCWPSSRPQSKVANFDIYTGTQIDVFGPSANTMWLIFEAEPDCDNVNNDGSWWYDEDDVSGEKQGVRCEGGCAGGEDASAIEILEMNFHGTDPVYHWSGFSRTQSAS